MTDFNDTYYHHNPQTWDGTVAVAVFLKKRNRLGSRWGLGNGGLWH